MIRELSLSKCQFTSLPRLFLENVPGGIATLLSPEDGDQVLDNWTTKFGLKPEVVESFKLYVREAFRDRFLTMKSFHKRVKISV